MEITSEKRSDGVLLVKLSGRLDIAGAGALDLPFAASLANWSGPVVVDMAGVGYMASLGVRTLLVNARSLNGRGGRMRLASPSVEVRAVLDALALDSILPIHDNIDDACAASRTDQTS